ncbi:MAG: DNA-processing protein DprA, partial [Lachnospiraceae bacterium]|nr:DNA-processing protein DprA [Lachnospiraceae bacterium]
GDYCSVHPNLSLASDLEEAKKIEADCLNKGIFIKTFKEYGIPDIPELPVILYCRGEWRTFYQSVGIVGTRRCTEYGKKITLETAEKLASQGSAIISGMAKGVDGYAHTAAIRAGGYTVAVLGNGPDLCFPSEHKSLMDSILKTGLIISEYPPGFHGDRSTFPQRNRIIAAFSDRLLVVESREKGGALITAEKARQYKKEVFAIPGRLDSPESVGTNRLIAENKAKLWLPEYCLSQEQQPEFDLYKEDAVETDPTQQLSPKADYSLSFRILSSLRKNKRRITTEDLGKELGVNVKDLITVITELEINDLVQTEGDMIWLQ